MSSRRHHGGGGNLLLMFLLSLLWLGFVSTSAASSTALVPATTPAAAVDTISPSQEQDSSDGQGGSNIVLAAVGFVKTSIVRTVDGCGQMWTNHKRCNEIRSKQKAFKQELRLEWENSANLDKNEINSRLRTVNGGITYDEYSFLLKGKKDRSKLTQLLLMSWAAPRFLPYAIMFFPNMLPSAFVGPSEAGAESKWFCLSRQRSHIVMKTLMNMETDAQVVPPMAKMNIFGRGAQKRAMEQTNVASRETAALFTNSIGPESLMDALQPHVYTKTEPTSKEINLVNLFPKSVIKGLSQVIEGRPSPVDNILPTFFARKKVLAHLQQIQESDEFLMDQNVDIGSLKSLQLWEACRDRLIGGVGTGASDDNLREQLQTWLDCAVTRPRTLEGGEKEYYNGNLARTALLCYNAMDATRNENSASYLPRCLYQAEFQPEKEQQIKSSGWRKK